MSPMERDYDSLIATVEAKRSTSPRQSKPSIELPDIKHVFEVKCFGGYKYFRTSREGRAFRKKRPDVVDDSCCDCCWLLKTPVQRDDEGYLYIHSGQWGMPRMIQVEPSTKQNHSGKQIEPLPESNEEEEDNSGDFCDNCDQSVCYALISDSDDSDDDAYDSPE